MRQRVWMCSEYPYSTAASGIRFDFWVPVMLWLERRLGLRGDGGPPEAVEVVVPLLLWSWLFEVALPRTELFGRYCVADHEDVLCYAAGALGAAVFWRCWYGDGVPEDVNVEGPR